MQPVLFNFGILLRSLDDKNHQSIFAARLLIFIVALRGSRSGRATHFYASVELELVSAPK